MAQNIPLKSFRSIFKPLEKDIVHWFPGHMSKGMKQIQHKLRSIDCIIEVHDARIPFSGRNDKFKHTIGGIKPHILVLNKVDLINNKLIPKIKNKLKDEVEHVIFTNCKSQQCNGIKRLFPLAQELINKSERYNRSEESDFCLMIIGVPNVGKSSLINNLRNKFLRKGNAAPTGAAPGITRSLMTKIKMSEKPLVYMLDTPGILTPHITNIEVGLKLALCNTIHEHLVGEDIIADYLLYWFNKNNKFEYVKKFNLKEATDDILDFLAQVAINNNKMLKFRNINGSYVMRPDIVSAAKFVIRMFQDGHLGKVMLDEDII